VLGEHPKSIRSGSGQRMTRGRLRRIDRDEAGYILTIYLPACLVYCVWVSVDAASPSTDVHHRRRSSSKAGRPHAFWFLVRRSVVLDERRLPRENKEGDPPKSSQVIAQLVSSRSAEPRNNLGKARPQLHSTRLGLNGHVCPASRNEHSIWTASCEQPTRRSPPCPPRRACAEQQALHSDSHRDRRRHPAPGRQTSTSTDPRRPVQTWPPTTPSPGPSQQRQLHPSDPPLPPRSPHPIPASPAVHRRRQPQRQQDPQQLRAQPEHSPAVRRAQDRDAAR